jgi:hypothetical protein
MRPPVEATPEELDEIKHRYVYLIVKRSASPEHALFAIEVGMFAEKVGPGADGWGADGEVRNLEIPVALYTGVRETYGKTRKFNKNNIFTLVCWLICCLFFCLIYNIFSILYILRTIYTKVGS